MRLNSATREIERWKRKFAAFNPTTLCAANEVDREWLIAECDSELLFIDQIRICQASPAIYLPTSAIYHVVERYYAPAVVLMRSVTAREKAWLTNFTLARKNLRRELTPKVSVDIALQQMTATLAFFRTQLPAMFVGISDGSDRGAFLSANQALIDGLEQYERWLRDDLAPHATGQFPVGVDAFRRMLADMTW